MKKNILLFVIVLILFVSCGWFSPKEPENVNLDVSKMTVGGNGLDVYIGPNSVIELENYSLSQGLIFSPSSKGLTRGTEESEESNTYTTYNKDIMLIPSDEGKYSGTGKDLGINGFASFHVSALGVDDDFKLVCSVTKYDGYVGFAEEFYYVNLKDKTSPYYSGKDGKFDETRVVVLSDSGGTGYTLVSRGGSKSSLSSGLSNFKNCHEFLIDFARYIPGANYCEKMFVVNPYILNEQSSSVTIKKDELAEVCVFQVEKSDGVSNYKVTIDGISTNTYDFRARYYDGGSIDYFAIPEFIDSDTIVLHLTGITKSVLFEIHPIIEQCGDSVTLTLAVDDNVPTYHDLTNLTEAFSIQAKDAGSKMVVYPFYSNADTTIMLSDITNVENGFVKTRRKGTFEQEDLNINEGLVPVKQGCSGAVFLQTSSKTEAGNNLVSVSKYEPKKLPYSIVMFDSNSNCYRKAKYDEEVEGDLKYRIDTLAKVIDTKEDIIKNLTAVFTGTYWSDKSYSYTDSKSNTHEHGRVYLKPALDRLEVKSENEDMNEMAFWDYNCKWPNSGSNIIAVSNSSSGNKDSQVTMTVKVIDTEKKILIVDLYIGNVTTFEESVPMEENVVLKYVHMHDFRLDEETGLAICQDSECGTVRKYSSIVVPGGITGTFTLKVKNGLPKGGSIVLFGSGFYLEMTEDETYVPGGNPSDIVINFAAPEGYAFKEVKFNKSASNPKYDFTLMKDK